MTRSFQPLVSGLLCAVMAFGPARAQPGGLTRTIARPPAHGDGIDRTLRSGGVAARQSVGCDIVRAGAAD